MVDDKKILPPLAKKAVNRIQKGNRKKELLIFTGQDALRLAKIRNYGGALALYYPPYEDPFRYRWPVKNHEALIHDLVPQGMPTEQLEKLSLALLLDDADVVRIVRPNGEFFKFVHTNYEVAA